MSLQKSGFPLPNLFSPFWAILFDFLVSGIFGEKYQEYRDRSRGCANNRLKQSYLDRRWLQDTSCNAVFDLYAPVDYYGRTWSGPVLPAGRDVAVRFATTAYYFSSSLHSSGDIFQEFVVAPIDASRYGLTPLFGPRTVTSKEFRKSNDFFPPTLIYHFQDLSLRLVGFL